MYSASGHDYYKWMQWTQRTPLYDVQSILKNRRNEKINLNSICTTAGQKSLSTFHNWYSECWPWTLSNPTAMDRAKKNHDFGQWMPKCVSSDPMWATIWTNRCHRRFWNDRIESHVSCIDARPSIEAFETIAISQHQAKRWYLLCHTFVKSSQFVRVPNSLAWWVSASRIRPSHIRHSINRLQ